ncbi:MAG: N-acetyltransferase [Gemmatimonadetes bacterium]|nr:N-acetyltransferase [Gemmatimonadota bacterium]
MGVEIRSESVGDEAHIDICVTRAFGSADEANLVRMLRDWQPGFDRDLSICAWDGDELVGHLAMTPLPMRLLGSRIPAVAVAPVAVIPPRQKQGIGGKMLAFGHDLASSKGIGLAFLTGHPSYYPQHGYENRFGFSRTNYQVDAIPDATVKLEPWPVQDQDIDWLLACDEREWQNVDFSWPRTGRREEWTTPGVNAVIWRTADGTRAAYTTKRSSQSGTGFPMDMILGDDAELVRQVIYRQKPVASPHHPAGWLAQHVLDPTWGVSEVHVEAPAMAIELTAGVLDQYQQALDQEGRLPGAINWPLPFSMC